MVVTLPTYGKEPETEIPGLVRKLVDTRRELAKLDETYKAFKILTRPHHNEFED